MRAGVDTKGLLKTTKCLGESMRVGVDPKGLLKTTKCLGESMRVGVDPKKAKRTPSFTTRRRTQSFRRHTKNLGKPCFNFFQP